MLATATSDKTVVVRSSQELYAGLSDPDVTSIHLTQTLRLDDQQWATPLIVSRNVTIGAHPTFAAINIYITLDCASLTRRIFLQPGAQLTFRWLELLNYVTDVGYAMLLLGPSPNATVVYDNVVQRRQAGFSGQRNLADLEALPRLAGSDPGEQVAFYLPRFCYNASEYSGQQCAEDVVYMVDIATSLPPTTSRYFAGEALLGQYDMRVLDSVHAVDVRVSPDCQGSASERECVDQQLRLLEVGRITITTHPWDRNLVKIVASLAILIVSVLLFLYFRRHYRTYQQRRARRMRRIKEALSMGPEGHGIMFNGLDGEEADWQIMPMPVGYAPEEEGEAVLHQDSNLRNLILDISTRPNRCIPDAPGGEGPRGELDTGDPIAAEVGLAAPPNKPPPPGGGKGGGGDGGGGAAGGGGGGAGCDGGGGSGGGAGTDGGRGEDVGPMGKLSSQSDSAAAEPAAAAGGGAAAGAGGSGPGGISVPAAARDVQGSMSATSAQSAARPMSILLSSNASRIGRQGSGAHGTGGGGGVARSPPLHANSLAITDAGVNALLATRAGATVASTGAASAASGVNDSIGASGGHGSAAAGAAGIGGSAAAAAAAAAGSGGGGSSAVNRHATSFAAADVAQRVMRSRDSDDDLQDEGADAHGAGGRAQKAQGQATDMMDELELLRREVMAGISDTQLQIMSVVGSGAFGTVYRGIWQGLEVAVKTVVFSASSENRKRALQEAALCQSINHRNIVATYAVDVQPLGAVNTPVLVQAGGRSSTLSALLDWRLYIVQEYCDGGPLRKLVQSRYLVTDAGPNMPVICEVALELAQALAHLHSKNIIHGDLNPNNVLLKRDASSPNGFRVKMADFGLSVMVPIQKTHMSNLRLGTLYYIAPETCFRGQLGYAADVFSLGVMLWELYHGRLAGTRTATGEPRYQPDFPDFPAACPVDYRKLAHRCLQKQPHNRLHSSQVVQRLQEMLAGYRAAGAPAALHGPPLPPLPPGGPDVSAHPAAPAAATHPAAAAAAAPAGPAHAAGAGAMVAHRLGPAVGAFAGVATPTESRHGPATPQAAAAGPGAAPASTVVLEISPAEAPARPPQPPPPRRWGSRR